MPPTSPHPPPAASASSRAAPAAQPRPGRLGPGPVAERRGPDPERRPADRPGPRQLVQPPHILRGAQHEPEPEPGQPVELAERTQHHQAGPAQPRAERKLGRDIGEALVHDQEPDAVRQRGEGLGRRSGRPSGLFGLTTTAASAPSSAAPRPPPPPPSRPRGTRPRARCRSARAPAPVPAAAGAAGAGSRPGRPPRGRQAARRRPIGAARRRGRRRRVLRPGQRPQQARIERRRRPGPAVDPGREVDPVGLRAAEPPHGRAEVAAVVAPAHRAATAAAPSASATSASARR